MKIAMIGHKRIPSREGGIELVVEELSVAMVQAGHQVTVYNRKGKHVAGASHESKERREYKGVQIINVPTFEHKALNAIVYAFLATLHACFCSYDVIHFHALGPSAMIPLARLFGKRCVATVHGLDWQRAKWGGFATRFLLFGEKMAARYAHEVIVLSEGLREYFLETYGRQTIRIVNGIEIPTKLSEQKEAEELTCFGLEREKYILFLARMVPEKGLHYLLEAFARVETDWKLVVAGGSSHSSEYMQQMQEVAKKDKRVVMTGFVQGETLTALYQGCYLYVLPSDIEGMPLSLLEALSFGRYSLVSNIRENMEIAPEFLYSFPKADITGLQQQITYLIESEEKRAEYPEYTQRIVSYMKEQYAWSAVVADTLKVYQKYL